MNKKLTSALSISLLLVMPSQLSAGNKKTAWTKLPYHNENTVQNTPESTDTQKDAPEKDFPEKENTEKIKEEEIVEKVSESVKKTEEKKDKLSKEEIVEKVSEPTKKTEEKKDDIEIDEAFSSITKYTAEKFYGGKGPRAQEWLKREHIKDKERSEYTRIGTTGIFEYVGQNKESLSKVTNENIPHSYIQLAECGKIVPYMIDIVDKMNKHNLQITEDNISKFRKAELVNKEKETAIAIAYLQELIKRIEKNEEFDGIVFAMSKEQEKQSKPNKNYSAIFSKALDIIKSLQKTDTQN